jgi:polar amino acid transport system substrate-binding protein
MFLGLHATFRYKKFPFCNKALILFHTFKWVSLLLFFSLSIKVLAAEKINIDVYVYHLKPPFIVSNTNRLGLYFDFSSYLNSKTNKYHFETVFVPRKRIETMLDSGKLDGILLGVNPTWFKDKTETKYLWTTNVYQDQDEVISLRENPVEYTGAESFRGKILGGIRGFYYFGIDEQVKLGEITRIDTIGEYELLQMIMLKRVDAGIVSRSTLEYLMKAKGWQNKFYLSKKPHDQYERRILIPHSKKDVYDEISPLIKALPNDPFWKLILKQY